jgi:hypothetical protein
MVACPKPKPSKHRKHKRTQSERVVLGERLDALVSAIFIMRDARCVTCGSTGGLTCSHFVKRGKAKLTFDLQNCNAQCFICNGKHNRWPEAYTHYILTYYGAETLARLTLNGQINAWKWTVPELRGFDASLTAEYERLMVLARPEVREWALRRVPPAVPA